jgi:hypothetical protein
MRPTVVFPAPIIPTKTMFPDARFGSVVLTVIMAGIVSEMCKIHQPKNKSPVARAFV